MFSLKGLLIAGGGGVMALASVSCAGTDNGTSADARYLPAYNAVPIWSSNQGRVPSPTYVPASQNVYALTGSEGREPTQGIVRTGDQRFSVGNGVIVLPPMR